MKLALLFGSVARDAANEDSDVDVAVDLQPGADVLEIRMVDRAFSGRRAMES